MAAYGAYDVIVGRYTFFFPNALCFYLMTQMQIAPSISKEIGQVVKDH